MKLVASTMLATAVFSSSLYAVENDTGQSTVPSLDNVRVTDVRNTRTGCLGTNQDEAITNGCLRARIGDQISVTVTDLRSLVSHSKCLDTSDKVVTTCSKRSIALFLEGREMKGLAPEAVDLDSKTLRFHLEKSDLTDEAWADLLGQPRWGAGRFFNRPTGLSVGLADGSPVESSIDSFQLSRIDIFWFWVSFVLLAIAIGLLIILALYTEMLRDLGPSPTPDFQTRWWLFGLTINAAHKPYSLARFQMAFWFSLVVITFLYIWLINGSMNTITASVLGLIGIGAGTALGAAMIEGGKK